MSDLPPEKVAELERLLAEATPGPWTWLREDTPPAPGFRFGGEGALNESGYAFSAQDAALLVAAVNALPFLIAEARKAETLREALRRIAEFGEERSFSFPADQMARLARAALEGASDAQV